MNVSRGPGTYLDTMAPADKKDGSSRSGRGRLPLPPVRRLKKKKKTQPGAAWSHLRLNSSVQLKNQGWAAVNQRHPPPVWTQPRDKTTDYKNKTQFVSSARQSFWARAA